MKDETKIELDRAARRFTGATLRMVENVARLNEAAVVLGKSALTLASELARPCVPVLDAGASVLEGLGDLWTADRTAAFASHLTIAAEGVKIVHDREGDATIEEIGEALRLAGKPQGDTQRPPPASGPVLN